MIRLKFRWQVESPLPAEWFDFDREENDMDFDPDTQPMEPVYEDGEWSPDDEVHDNFGFQDADIRTCPVCGAMLIVHHEPGFDRFYDASGLHSCPE